MPIASLCDAKADCTDGSDESHAACGKNGISIGMYAFGLIRLLPLPIPINQGRFCNNSEADTLLFQSDYL